MGKSVSIELRYNALKPSSESFINSFKKDIAHCLTRFKIESTFVESGSNGDYCLVLFTNDDINDKNRLENLSKDLKDSNRTFLLTLEPAAKSNSVLGHHKFLTFRFWDQIIETGEIRMFRRDSKATQTLYWERITDIVVEIFERNSQSAAKKGKVFLAQTDVSQFDDRDNIKRDLNDLGYEVVPDKMLSQDFEESVNQLKDALTDCNLILHLIPSTYTGYFSHSKISVIEHQFNFTADYIAKNHSKISRLVWIPSDFEFSDEENQIFVEKIQRDQDQSHNTLVLKVNLEDLKRIYRKILSGENLKVDNQKPLPDVYVIADKEAESVAKTVNLSAKDIGLKVGANYNGISYNQHLKCLANAQVVVINYTSENKQWINVKIHDILKSPGLETSKPNKRLILVKNAKDLDTSHFEQYFNEIHVVDANEIKLNLS